MTDVSQLNAMDEAAFRQEMSRCCGATRWVEGMLARRPFSSIDAVYQAANDIWHSLSPEDWLEAFTHHPQIGDINTLREKFSNAKAWAENEQSGVNVASETILQGLADGNRQYEEKYGYIFIVCATGKSAEEMLHILQQRLENDPVAELRIAAEEQRKITRLRLEKL